MIFYRRNADFDLRSLERQAQSGGYIELKRYLEACRRADIEPNHQLPVSYINDHIASLGVTNNLSYEGLLHLVSVARKVGVAIFLDKEFYKVFRDSGDWQTDWFLEPDILPELEAKGVRIGYYYPDKPAPELLVYVEQEGNPPRVSEERRDMFTQSNIVVGYFQADPILTYADIQLKALNPPHMCYGNCYCIACSLHGCGCMDNLVE